MDERGFHEQALQAGENALLKQLIAWIGGGTLLLILFIFALLAAIVMFLAGGTSGTTNGPPIGTASSRPVEWLGYPAVASSSLPNAVILSVMAHESSGRIFAMNYNCSNGQPAAQQCSQAYPGTKTLSEDAGLMQINSGGWPAPAKASKWQSLGMSSDPFDPTLNIPAGVHELTADLRQTGYLEYALEAYNSGSGGQNSTDTAYPAAVKSYLTTYESQPTISAWSTADWSHGQWTMTKGQRVWLIVSVAGPYGAKFSVPWKPSPPKCTTTTDPSTGKVVTSCKAQPPVLVKGRDLVQPSTVAANGVPMALDPSGAPVWPGASVWAVEVSQPGAYYITATWPASKGTKSHTATTNITLIGR